MNKKFILLGIMILGVVGLTIAFAVLSTTLRISGTASVPNVSWNIHFQNWTNNTQGTANGHTNTAVYPDAGDLQQTVSKNNSTKVEGLNVTLNQPGDYVSYKFQIINEGTIDASLSNFSHNLTCASGNDCSHLSYEVECTDQTTGGNNVLVEHSTLAKNGGLAYCTLTVTYSDTTNQNSGNAGSNQVYEKSAASAELAATWVYVQKTDSVANSESGSGSGNEQQGGSSSSEENQYIYYYGEYDSIEGTPLSQDTSNPSKNVWIQENTTTGIREVCGKFSDGTVCFNKNSHDWIEMDSTIDTDGQKSLKLIQDFNSAGATNCRIDSTNITCSENNIECGAWYDGVSCSDMSNSVYCNIYYDGQFGC